MIKNKKHFHLVLILALAFLLCLGAPVVFATGDDTAGDDAAAGTTDITDLSGLENSSDPLQAFRDKQAELQKEIEQLEESIKNQNAAIKGYENEIAALEAEMLTAQRQIDAIQVSIDEAEAQIELAEQQIIEAEERLEQRQAYLEQRLINLYIYGEVDMLDVILQSESFEDFLAVADMTEAIMRQDKHMLNSIAVERQTIINNKAHMETMRDELVVMTYEFEDMKLDLAARQQEKMATMSQLAATRDGEQAILDSFEAASAEVSSMIREYMASNTDNISYGGSMIWPLPSPWGKNWVTSEYGNRWHPLSGKWSFHTGIDIAADGGTPIYAASDGKIISRGWIGGYGETIIINHGDNISTLYAHQSAYGSFKVGDYVVQGDIIGYVGTTGNSTGNHLHFEVRLNGSHTSPWNYLN